MASLEDGWYRRICRLPAGGVGASTYPWCVIGMPGIPLHVQVPIARRGYELAQLRAALVAAAAGGGGRLVLLSGEP